MHGFGLVVSDAECDVGVELCTPIAKKRALVALLNDIRACIDTPAYQVGVSLRTAACP